MKNNKFMIVISILLIVVMLIGTTFSFFAISTGSNENAVDMTAATFGASVEVTALYNDRSLIPMDDKDVMKGYNQQCIDDKGFGACQAYTIHISNTGDKNSYTGTIKFNVTDIENLKYLILDEENNKYVSDTAIISGEDQTLGDSFELDTDESRDFVLVIWLSNLNGPQDDYDAGGSFSASVTYESTHGSRITGTFSVN